VHVVNGDSVFFLLHRLPFASGSLACVPSELIWNYESYGQLIWLVWRVISPIARPLSTQDDINTEGKRTDSYASNGIRTHDPSVERTKTFNALDCAANVIGSVILMKHNCEIMLSPINVKRLFVSRYVVTFWIAECEEHRPCSVTFRFAFPYICSKPRR
jgi:hypothetical protein